MREIKMLYDWEVKKLIDMNDEDWWMFQIDFKINYENPCNLKPIRFWNECPISL